MTQDHCSYDGCPELPWANCPEGRCIHHSPSNSHREEDRRILWQEARRRVDLSGDCDFTGWHFPEDPGGECFRRIGFRGETCFHRATFDGKVDFNEATFGKPGADFTEATFTGDTGFAKVTFEGEADFGGAVFSDEVRFCRSVFKARVDFDGVRFTRDANFWGAVFEKGVEFIGAVFRGKTDFGRATFQTMASFSSAHAEHGVEVWFALPKWPALQHTPFRRPEQGETAYRLAKQAAQNRGDYPMAGEYHYAERCAIEHGNRKQWGWKPWHPLRFACCWLELVLARLVWGYGERPCRILAAGALTIAVFGLLCFFLAGIQPSRPETPSQQLSMGECLYFSVVTFTTLGYGDFLPKPHFRPWAATEAALGAGLIAAFIVSLTRKFMR